MPHAGHQVSIGLLAYVFPGWSLRGRKGLRPYHVFLGLSVYILGLATMAVSSPPSAAPRPALHLQTQPPESHATPLVSRPDCRRRRRSSKREDPTFAPECWCCLPSWGSCWPAPGASTSYITLPPASPQPPPPSQTRTPWADMPARLCPGQFEPIDQMLQGYRPDACISSTCRSCCWRPAACAPRPKQTRDRRLFGCKFCLLVFPSSARSSL